MDQLAFQCMLSIAEGGRDLLRMEQNNGSKGDIKKQRRQLKDEYVTFVKKYGRFNSPDNIRIMDGDPNAPFLASMEVPMRLRKTGWGAGDLFYKKSPAGTYAADIVPVASGSLPGSSTIGARGGGGENRESDESESESESESKSKSKSESVSLPSPTPPRLQFQLPKWRPPNMLPHGMVSTDDMSVEEIVAEAQASPPMLRCLGFKDAAMAHPHETNIRYLRTCHFIGQLPLRPYFLQYGLTLLIALGFAIGFYLGPTQSETSDLEVSKVTYMIVGGVVGFVFGLGAGFMARCQAQFWTAYARARVAQKHTDGIGQRRTVAIYELPLLRLAFADRPAERFFSGVEDKSGFINGRMNLETDHELATIVDPRQLYVPGVVRPCDSSFTGVNTSRRHSLNGSAKHAGRINAQKQSIRERPSGLEGWLGEHKGLTFFMVSAGVSLLVLMIGVDIDLSSIKDVVG